MCGTKINVLGWSKTILENDKSANYFKIQITTQDIEQLIKKISPALTVRLIISLKLLITGQRTIYFKKCHFGIWKWQKLTILIR